MALPGYKSHFRLAPAMNVQIQSCANRLTRSRLADETVSAIMNKSILLVKKYHCWSISYFSCFLHFALLGSAEKIKAIVNVKKKTGQ